MPTRAYCQLDSLLTLIGEPWTLAILHQLSAGPRRTSELHQAFEGLSTKTLADRLKKLHRKGLINRTSYPESPPRVEYGLTERGKDFLGLLQSLAEIAARLDDEESPPESAETCEACAAFHPPTRAESPPPRPRKRQDVTLL